MSSLPSSRISADPDWVGLCVEAGGEDPENAALARDQIERCEGISSDSGERLVPLMTQSESSKSRDAAVHAAGKIEGTIPFAVMAAVQTTLQRDPDSDVRETAIQTLVNFAAQMPLAMIASVLQDLDEITHVGATGRSLRECRLAGIAQDRFRDRLSRLAALKSAALKPPEAG